MTDNTNYYIDNIKAGAELNGIDVGADAVRKLALYCCAFEEINKSVNLSAIREPADIVYKHIIDCLCMIKYARIENGDAEIADIGTGGGFPAAPVAAVCDESSVFAIDSTAKKLNCVKRCAEEAGIGNVKTVAGRAEELALKPPHRDRFDVATARAVADLPVLCEICLPLVRVGGRFIAMKSTRDERTPQLDRLGAELEETVEYVVRTPVENLERKLYIMKKTAATEKNYPRKYAAIIKNPLI